MFITVTTYEGAETSIMIDVIKSFSDGRIYLTSLERNWFDVRQTREEIADMITKANTVTVQSKEIN